MNITLAKSLSTLGFSISDDSDIYNALKQCTLSRNEDSCPEFVGQEIKIGKEPIFSENYPVTFEDKGLRDFIQENFEEQIGGITLTDEELDQFKRHLEASLSDWISENWREFTENRGD
ncbi:MAG: hypothetical protein ABH886_06190 [Candidatus Desantisbacteria bacterium]